MKTNTVKDKQKRRPGGSLKPFGSEGVAQIYRDALQLISDGPRNCPNRRFARATLIFVDCLTAHPPNDKLTGREQPTVTSRLKQTEPAAPGPAQRLVG
jgi:hypothetical protein